MLQLTVVHAAVPTMRRYTAMKEHAGSANGAAKCTRSIPSPRPTASSNGTDDATGNIGAMRSAAREPRA